MLIRLLDALNNPDVAPACHLDGHDPVPSLRTILGGAYAEHWQTCSRCPASRRGLLRLSGPDAELVWDEWRLPLEGSSKWPPEPRGTR